MANRCLACGRGCAWGGRCHLCPAWQLACWACNRPFASSRSHVGTCSHYRGPSRIVAEEWTP